MNTGTPRMLDARLLIMTQWLSPGYPVGAFAFSHGLETACAERGIVEADGLQDWLEALLTHGSGWSDAVWIGMAARGAGAFQAVNALAEAYAASSERLREGRRQGAAFAAVTASVWEIDLPTGMLPVVLGTAARRMGLDAETVIALYLQSFLGNLVAAAQRLMPLGQTGAQRILARLAPLCAEVAARAAVADEDDVFSIAYASDIAAMRHESQATRVFQS